MTAAENLSELILFNPLKHHLNFIRKYIRAYKQKDHQQLQSDLSKIGNTQMDLYLGELSVSKITEEVIAFLKKANLLEKCSFFRFLDQHSGFIEISLSDQSTWILRKGFDPLAFVHIHPARYSKHTIRIKATTLKSIIAAKIVLRNTSSIDLSEMNAIRVKYLHLSPVKFLGTNTFNLLKMLSFVEQ